MIIDFFAIYFESMRAGGGKLEALASCACASGLQKLHRVAVFFVQPVVKKQSPLRGSDNIREARIKVKLAKKAAQAVRQLGLEKMIHCESRNPIRPLLNTHPKRSSE
jgi:hypothetical protein